MLAATRLFLLLALLAFAPASVSAEPSLQARRGAYVAQLADCEACHTAAHGATMAGGRELPTPFGVLYSTNITPDPRTGIGGYTFEQFDAAMRRGVAADGHHLYPAMPYTSYAKASEEDMRALYAYLTEAVTPVTQPNKPAQMHWPFSQRWGLALWKMAFLDPARFQPEPRNDAVWNRGAYIVQTWGHCGACHTPRGIAFQERATSDAGRYGRHYLAGETMEQWRAVSLRNLWTVEDTAQLLKSGQNRFAAATGGMTEVIQRSTQHFSDADLVAVATYLKSLPAGEADVPMPAPATAAVAPESLYTTRGGLAYAQFCVDCHRLDGAGVKDVFPPLRQNPAVTSQDAATLLHILLTGFRTPETSARPRAYTMPAFARLSDREIAEIASFVRTSWGNNAAPVPAFLVRSARTSLGAKFAESSPGFDTPRLADMLARPNAAVLVRGMRLHLETKTLLPENVGNSLNCTSCHLNAGTVADGSPFVGVSAFFPSYAPRAGRVITLAERINGCFLRSMDGKPLPADSADLKAMVAFFDWMKKETKPTDKVAGRGVGKIELTIKPDAQRGVKVYETQCAVCHGEDGQGLEQADGAIVYPPLWGEESFNIGAGMARTYTAAAFVKRNMPIGFREQFPLGQGGLSDQDAVDVAEYFSHQPRPDFPAKVKDWPKDPKPADSRY